jgi:hypothetical protein
MIRKRITVANATSFVALFVALSAGSYAAVSLPANSVGSRQIKAKAVTNKKLGNRSVSSTKVAAGAIDGTKVKDHSLDGSDINMSALGKVPSAAAADTAGTAGSASITRVKTASTTATSTASDGTGGRIDGATATCDQGLVVTGGGVAVSTPSNQFVIDDAPNGNAAWSGHVVNFDTSPHDFTVYAICAPAASTQ